MIKGERSIECAQLVRLMALHTDDEMVGGVDDIEAHIAACAVCQQAEAALHKVVRQHREAHADELPADLEQRLLDQLCGSR